MKRTLKIVSSIADYTQYLKEKGKVAPNEELKNIKISIKNGQIISTYEGTDELVSIETETPLKKLLSENLQQFLKRKDASERLFNHLPAGVARALRQDDKNYSNVTVGDLMLFKVKDLEKANFRGIANKSISELIQYIGEEELLKGYPLYGA